MQSPIRRRSITLSEAYDSVTLELVRRATETSDGHLHLASLHTSMPIMSSTTACIQDITHDDVEDSDPSIAGSVHLCPVLHALLQIAQHLERSPMGSTQVQQRVPGCWRNFLT